MKSNAWSTSGSFGRRNFLHFVIIYSTTLFAYWMVYLFCLFALTGQPTQLRRIFWVHLWLLRRGRLLATYPTRLFHILSDLLRRALGKHSWTTCWVCPFQRGRMSFGRGSNPAERLFYSVQSDHVESRFPHCRSGWDDHMDSAQISAAFGWSVEAEVSYF